MKAAIIGACWYGFYRLLFSFGGRASARSEVVERAAAPLPLDDNTAELRKIGSRATHSGRFSPDGAAAPDANPWARGPDDRPLP